MDHFDSIQNPFGRRTLLGLGAMSGLRGKTSASVSVASRTPTLDADVAALINTDGSATHSTFVDRTEQWTAVVNARNFGLSESRSAKENTEALKDAAAHAVSEGRALFIPEGAFEVDAPALVVDGVDNFRLEMKGTLRRCNQSRRSATIVLQGLTHARIGTINIDGNASENEFVAGSSVDEAKHDIQIADCRDLTIDVVNSLNPSGDSIYFGGSGQPSNGVRIGHVNATADNDMGRNAVSIITGHNIQIGTLFSSNIGSPTMPGGFVIEPNAATDTVSSVSIGEAFVETAGTSGFAAISTHGRIITNFVFGRAVLRRRAGALPASAGFYLRGVSSCTGCVTVIGDGVGGTAALCDADQIDLDMSLSNSGGVGLTIGRPGVSASGISRSRLRGSVRGARSHLVACHDLADSTVDLDLRDSGPSSTYFVLSAGTSLSNVVLRGNWSKGESGLRCFGGGGSSGRIKNTTLDGVNFTGWPIGARRSGGSDIDHIRTRECPGFNDALSPPAFDQYEIGCVIMNREPKPGAPVGWISTFRGCPTSTAMWLSIGTVGNDDITSSAQLDSASSHINMFGKFYGKRVINTTTNQHLISLGESPESVWANYDGTTTHFPE